MTAVLGPPGKRVVTGHVHLPGRSDAVERYRARRLAQLARDAGTKRAHRRTAPEAATHPCCRGGSASPARTSHNHLPDVRLADLGLGLPDSGYQSERCTLTCSKHPTPPRGHSLVRAG